MTVQHTETANTAAPGLPSISEHIAVARGTLIDRYVVLDEIGAGGVGIVLKAYDPELGRHVAIKLLQVGSAAQTAHAVLLREGQAIAKLSHPNVVSVYDVGSYRDEVFIAMELIRGRSLREWMADKRRSWREVVPVFVQAGRGLAAAHGAGIVHRDFKPANAILGDDGRVRVLDFGLARIFESANVDAADLPDALSSTPTETLSQTRGVSGTPAYMSPEQYNGDAADARSDVFSFCVSLYEAFTGRRPFVGDSVRELRINVLAGDVQPFPDDVAIPGWLRALLLRGLASDPRERFATIGELVDELDADRKRSFVVPALAIAAVVGAAGAMLVFGGAKQSAHTQLCDAGETRTAHVWNASAKQRLHTAFASTKLSFASEASKEVVHQIDEYVGDLARAHDQACHDTHVAGLVSETMLDKRAACLGGRLRVVAAVIETLASRPTRQTVTKATETIARLPGLDGCNNIARLSGIRVPRPEQIPMLGPVQERFAEGQAAIAAGDYKRASAVLEKASNEAATIGYMPLQSDIVYQLGVSYGKQSRQADALKAHLRSAHFAAKAGLDYDVAAAYVEYAQRASDHKMTKPMGALIMQIASTAVERANSPPVMVSALLAARGMIATRSGNLKQAVEHFRASAEDFPYKTATALQGLRIRLGVGTSLLRAGRYDEAIAQLEKLLPAFVSHIGSRHPTTGNVHRQLAVLYQRRGKNAKARAHNNRAMAIFTAAFGETHAKTTTTIEWAGVLAQDAGKWKEAVRLLRRVVALRTKAQGAESVDIAVAKVNLANALAGSNKTGKALAELHEAVAIIAKHGGPKHQRYSDVLLNLASVQGDVNRYDAAIATYKRAIASIELRLGKDHVDLTYAMLGIAKNMLRANRPAQAIAYARRGIPLAKGLAPEQQFLMKIYLGRALWRAGQDRRGGHKLVVDAANGLIKRGGAAATEGREHLAWASKHPASG